MMTSMIKIMMLTRQVTRALIVTRYVTQMVKSARDGMIGLILDEANYMIGDVLDSVCEHRDKIEKDKQSPEHEEENLIILCESHKTQD